MNIRITTLFTLSLIALFTQGAAATGPTSDSHAIERGKYLTTISGCNDCHTPGYAESDGKVPVNKWLTGSAVGFQGPWGTSYPANLRLTMSKWSEAQWLVRARRPMLPPMPWFNLREMSDQDLSSIYLFIRSLGPEGEPVPVAMGPGKPVATPYFEFVPKNLPTQVKHVKR